MQKVALQVFLAIALVLLAGYYWSPGGNPDADPETVKRQMALPKTYLQDTRSWEYNEEGVLTEIMEASQAEFFAGRDESELTQPRFYSHDGNDRTWSASAERGQFRHRPGVLLLRRNVVLSNDQTGGKLVTQAMSLNTNRKIAKSQVPVTVTQGQSSMRADGMLADLNKEQITMRPNVETTYYAR